MGMWQNQFNAEQQSPTMRFVPNSGEGEQALNNGFGDMTNGDMLAMLFARELSQDPMELFGDQQQRAMAVHRLMMSPESGTQTRAGPSTWAGGLASTSTIHSMRVPCPVVLITRRLAASTPTTTARSTTHSPGSDGVTPRWAAAVPVDPAAGAQCRRGRPTSCVMGSLCRSASHPLPRQAPRWR